MFGTTVSRIIDGLIKIEGISETTSTSAQAATIKKVLLSLSDDVRVILIKLADRLHNMRTLESMPRLKQLKIASETKFIYAPLAHRLGLYNIKTELEELSFKYSNPDAYKQMLKNIEKNRPELMRRFELFKHPIEEHLKRLGKKVEIRLREKSAYSIWRNMKEKDMEFKDVYLTPTVEFILETQPESEKLECWSVYASVTNVYKSNSKKLIDMISQPKANGYSAIHTTVMMPGGIWVDVQIRSKRMDEIAQKGYTAYIKHKGSDSDDEGLNKWLERTRELLWSSDDDAIPFIDALKTDLFSDEIYVFTPKGDIVTLPTGATVLDFAFAIHTDLGYKSIGANVNHKLVSVDHPLQTGDQVQIITSKKQKPSEHQLNFVVTTRAKTWIKKAIKAERKKFLPEGITLFEKICKELKADQKLCDVKNLMEKFNIKENTDFFYYIATGKISIKEIKNVLFPQEKKSIWRMIPYILPGNFAFQKKTGDKEKENLISENKEDFAHLSYVVSSCCNPIPGDDVVSIKRPGGPLEIHRIDCDEAVKLMSQYGKSVSDPEWGKGDDLYFLAGIKITAKNEKGLIKKISSIITDDFNLNIKKFDLETIGEMVTADILLYLKDLKTLNNLMKKLKKAEPVIKVSRLINF
jgi:GTP pyrophosphokinase